MNIVAYAFLVCLIGWVFVWNYDMHKQVLVGAIAATVCFAISLLGFVKNWPYVFGGFAFVTAYFAPLVNVQFWHILISVILVVVYARHKIREW